MKHLFDDPRIAAANAKIRTARNELGTTRMMIASLQRLGRRQEQDVMAAIRELNSIQIPPPVIPKEIKSHTATFTPQSWVNNTAMEVDPEGETTWIVDPDEIEPGMEVPDSDESDDLRFSRHAPTWVREWRGPFYVTLESPEEED